MRADVKEELLKAQESKLDAVVIYRYLASRAKNEEIKSTLMKIASDEGKHAGMLRKYTNTSLKKKEKPAFRFRLMTRVFGLKMMLRMMLTTEQKSVEAYRPAAAGNPQLRDLLKDERRHVDLITEMLNKKKK